MIAYLNGTVLAKEDKYLVLQAEGVGYKVFATGDTLISAKDGEKTALWIHHAIREDASDLYGFASRDELRFFELLISISGIGPRTALGILNMTSLSALKNAVSSGETGHLVKVGGVGKKLADKIVLELKDKIGIQNDGAGLKEEVDTIEALKALGFSHNAAREALRQVSDEPDTGAKIKRALKILGK